MVGVFERPTDVSCGSGAQPYWYKWGPIVLLKGTHTHQFLGFGVNGDGSVEDGPVVAQGGKAILRIASFKSCHDDFIDY